MCMMSYMVIDIQISLDTNIWIFGLFENNMYCIRILDNLARFHIVVSNQIRIELTNNLPKPILNEFYQLVQEASVELNYEKVPEIYITMFESMGLKKGDAIIGGFAEWKKIDKIGMELLRNGIIGVRVTLIQDKEMS